MQIKDWERALFIFLFFSNNGLRYVINRTSLYVMIFIIIFSYFLFVIHILIYQNLSIYTFIFYLQLLLSTSLRTIFFLIYQLMLLSHSVFLSTNLPHKLSHHYTSSCHTRVLNLVYIHLYNFFLQAKWTIPIHAFDHLPIHLYIIYHHYISWHLAHFYDYPWIILHTRFHQAI